jgi:O-antigen ligase
VKIKIFIIIFILLTEFYINSFFNSKTIELVLSLIILIQTRHLKKDRLLKAFLFLLILNLNFLNIENYLNFGSEFLKILTSIFLFLSLDLNKKFKDRLLKNIFYFAIFFSMFLIINVLNFGSPYILKIGTFYLSYDLSIPIILIPLFVVELKNKINTKLLYIGLFILVFYLLISSWRAIQLGFIFMIFCYLLTSKLKIIKLSAFMFLIGFLFFFNKVVENNSSDIEILVEGDDLSSGRVFLWAKSVKVFENYNLINKLIGSGIGQFPVAINSISSGAYELNILNNNFSSENTKDKNSRIHAHNPFFNILIENGIFGIFLYLYFIRMIFKNNSKSYNKSANYLSLLTSIVAGFFTSITYFTLPLLWVLYYFSKDNNK